MGLLQEKSILSFFEFFAIINKFFGLVKNFLTNLNKHIV
jgi:hypothetical protein